MRYSKLSLPQRWELKKLSGVLKIQNGYAFDSKLFTTDSGTPLIRIRDIKKGIKTEVNFSGVYNKKYEVKSGDYLIGMDGDFGCYEWKGGKALLNQRVCRLQDFSDRLHPRFLFYGINKYLKAIEDVTSFATVKHISSKQIENIEIPLPPISEQMRIVALLDKAFAAIDKAKTNTEKNLQNVRELFESYLDGVFGKIDGEVRKLRDICEISSKLIDPKKKEFQNLIHIGAGNIESRTGELFDLKTAKEENLISGKFLFDESMVLYSKIRPYLMKVVKCEFSGLCSADIYPLKPFDDIVTKDFLFQILLSRDFTDYAILGSQRAGMPKVNREHLFEYEVKLPSMQKQKLIVKNLNSLNYQFKRLERNYRSKLRSLDELKRTMLEKTFSGEL